MEADTPDEYRAKLKLIAAVAGGDPDNLNTTVNAALRDADNNIIPALIAIFVIGLTAADYALTGYDAYQLTKAGLACDAGDTAACAEAAQMAKDFAIETGVTLTAGAFVPGEIGMKILGALRKNGSDEVVEAAEKAGREVATNKALTKTEISGAGLPNLPHGYHYRTVGGEIQIVRNPGQTGSLPEMHLEGGNLVPGPKPGIVRSTATRSAFLKDLANNDKIPANIKPWLRKRRASSGICRAS